MLRINLLPPYIYDKNKKRNVAFAWVGGAAACIAGMMLLLSQASAALSEQEKAKEEANNYKTQYDAASKRIEDAKSNSAIAVGKQGFIADALANNKAWPDLLIQMRDLTSQNVLLYTLNVQAPSAVNMTGFAQKEAYLAEWLGRLRTHPETFSNVSVSLPEHAYTPDVAAVAPGGQIGGVGGPGSGPPQSFAGSFGGGGSRPGLPGAAFGSSGPGGRGMGMTGAGGFGSRGGFGGGGSTGATTTEAEVEGKRGLNFVASMTLKNLFNGGKPAPTWTGGAAGGTGGGVPTGFGGGMPGSFGGGGTPTGFNSGYGSMGGAAGAPSSAGAASGKAGGRGED